jgi:hypothetical protein
MGYTIKIGNAVPVWEPEDDYCSWAVEAAALDAAPVFPNDDMTGNGNDRSPSYTGWAEFSRWAGLHDFFFGEDGGLMSRHPGVRPLRNEHLAAVSAARSLIEAKHSDLRPGFAVMDFEREHYTRTGREFDSHSYRLEDANYARILWLEWWMDWALKSCERPAIGNT